MHWKSSRLKWWLTIAKQRRRIIGVLRQIRIVIHIDIIWKIHIWWYINRCVCFQANYKENRRYEKKWIFEKIYESNKTIPVFFDNGSTCFHFSFLFCAAISLPLLIGLYLSPQIIAIAKDFIMWNFTETPFDRFFLAIGRCFVWNNEIL